ncbi:Hypothetical protein FKW44_025389 [Caligus rogercresseyi]|uniref:Uncharacterized protein n=1 Tax=Caligus rogercresseyi TaxID=217165 RepID=A0A7T8GLB9_CALRO|nr:Hypothetical protein FKW44_025389 [Caligus rogercresseyi]
MLVACLSSGDEFHVYAMLNAEVHPIELGLLRSLVPLLVLESEVQRTSLRGEFER